MDHEIYQALSSAAHWATAAVTFAVVAICVLTHYTVLDRLNAALATSPIPPRPRILFVISIVILLHVIEIWVFALAFHLLLLDGRYGHLHGTDQLALVDSVYFSAASYTTAGYGDLYVTGALRLMAGTEALVGLVQITWSASFTFLEMSQYWTPRRAPSSGPASA